MALTSPVHLALLLLANASLLIHYKFDQIYDTRILDDSFNLNDAVKPTVGTTTTVNTPSGLLLSGTTLTLPPNAYRSTFPYSTSFTVTFIVRYFKVINGLDQQGRFLKFDNLLKLTKDTSKNSDNSSKDFNVWVNLTTNAVSLHSTNLFANNIWTFLAVTVNSSSGTVMSSCTSTTL
jgi:hypothetical protein